MSNLPEGVKPPSKYKKSIAGQRGWIEGFTDVLLKISAPPADDLQRHQGTTYAIAYWLGRADAEDWQKSNEVKP